ncbi:MAG TPA: hypothetical protein VHC90_20045 [Bryobacteraceae bacterium]|nr:hypothetical protein [Bryobacteraceae bacterium]
MRKLILFLFALSPAFALTCPSGFVELSQTGIVDAVTGLSYTGQLTVTRTYNDSNARGDQQTIAITNGVIDVCLAGGSSYSVRQRASGSGLTIAPVWTTPASGGPYGLADIEGSGPVTPDTHIAPSQIFGSDGVVKISGGQGGIVSGSPTDCVLVNGTSNTCGTGGGATIPSVTNLISGSGNGNGADSGIQPASVVQLSAVQSLTNKTLDGISPTIMGYLGNISSDVQAQLNVKGTVTSITADSPLTGGAINTSGHIGIPQASGSASGYLSTADWSTFSAKQSALSGTWNQIAGTPDKATGSLALRRMTSGDLPPLVTSYVAANLASNWTLRTTPQTAQWGNIAYSPELRRLVAVAFSTGAYGHVMTSDDGGITWTLRTTPGDAYQWNGLVWSDSLALFIALSHSTSGVTSSMTSPDGINWTLQASSAALTGGVWDQVVSNSSGRLCAVSGRANSTSAYSSDGINWTSGGVVSATSATSSAVWSTELGIFVAAGSQGAFNGGFYTSPDCVTWTAHVNPAGSTQGWQRIAWSPQLGIFVAVANTTGGAGQRVATSADGANWISHSSTDDTSGWTALAWSPQLGLFAALSGSGEVMYSPDGANWTAGNAPSPARQWWRAIWLADYGWFVSVDDGSASSPQAVTSAPIQSSPFSPLPTLPWTFLTGVPSTFAPSAHASTHQYGGSDPVATATPGANAIPQADGTGKLNSGWIPTLNQNTTGTASNVSGVTADSTFTQDNGAGGVQSSGKAVPTGAVVGTSDTQTLTNKTVDGVSPATMAYLDATSSIQTQLNAKLNAASNLSDLASAGTARTNLGLAAIAASGSASDLGSGTLPSARLATAIRAGGFSLLFRGSDATAGTTLYVTIPYACTITDWVITGDSTATIKLWRVADGGSAVPTVSNSISTSGFALSSGTRIHSTTLTDLSSTAIAAYDTFGVNLFASASTHVEFTLGCTR